MGQWAALIGRALITCGNRLKEVRVLSRQYLLEPISPSLRNAVKHFIRSRRPGALKVTRGDEETRRRGDEETNRRAQTLSPALPTWTDPSPGLIHHSSSGVSWEQEEETGNRRQGAGGRGQEAGGREQEAGGREQETRGRRKGTGRREQEEGSRRQGAGGREQEEGGTLSLSLLH
ncbi:hypothetical protein EYF80_056729 [Liparis tanakae]|uniref:Uncharacterized protein n=1 Tax=Liparis tanakae TaxID=230148 RepID=A0A4Z2EWD3_9TELE|nr:hypothetical protein EYF80_056729 [Liparis tanakae]